MIAFDLKGHILVIDDNKEITGLLEKFLTRKNYKVSIANAGDEGVDKYKQTCPNLVLLDITMPGKNGVDTLKEIRKINPEARVVMVTAVGEEKVIKVCKELGAADYLLKPFDWISLEQKVLNNISPSTNCESK